MKIGIDINGVLRDTISKFEQTYEKFMIEKNEEMDNLMMLEISGDTFNEESFEVVDEIKKSNFKYEKLSEVTSLTLINHFTFKDSDEYYNFLYEEFAMIIFGHAGSSEYSTFNYLNEIYTNLRDTHDFIIVSDEMGKSKPATLFFLSKFG
jgi:FMN phosphatase YigB (HAD superfamily)